MPKPDSIVKAAAFLKELTTTNGLQVVLGPISGVQGLGFRGV